MLFRSAIAQTAADDDNDDEKEERQGEGEGDEEFDIAPRVRAQAKVVTRGRRGRFVRASFEWEEVPGAERYILHLCRVIPDAPSDCEEVRNGTVRLHRFRLKAGLYSWRVQAIGPAGAAGPTSPEHTLDARDVPPEGEASEMESDGLPQRTRIRQSSGGRTRTVSIFDGR